ncbi:MAG: XTP/dITP diphosphatase [Thermodesulfobacterium sp.]|nr:XTP/dITP diphosphatase [Thermodesulfobacterium sp.]
MKPKEILIATTNLGKVREIEPMLKDLGFLEIKTLKDFSPIPPPEEKGSTFLENALEKASYYAKNFNILTLADDSGLEVEALSGAPGIHSSRFAGDKATDEENIKKLLRLLEGVPFEKRKARFVCVIVVYHPSGKWIYAEGEWQGYIAEEPRGTQGFGYDPVFLVPEYNLERTAAELSKEEKNRISHRAKAIRAIIPKLKEFLEKIED